jgi:hypothetical protein
MRAPSESVSKVIGSFAKITGLPHILFPAILLSLGDRMASMAALEAARNCFNLDDRQVIAGNLVTKLPSVVQFFLFSFIPVTLTIFPKNVAVRFLVNYFLVFTVISAIGVVLSKLYLSDQIRGGIIDNRKPMPKISWQEAVKVSVSKAIRPFLRISISMVMMTMLVTFAIESGILQNLVVLVPFTGQRINAEIIPYIGAGVTSMLGGVAAVGAGFKTGAVSEDSIVQMLFVISIVHNVCDLCSASIPRCIAVYGRRLGLKVSMISFLVTQATMLTFLFLLKYGVV